MTADMETEATRVRSRVLIVDDDAELLDLLEVALSADGHTCELAADGLAAQEILRRQTIDVVVSDIRMGGMSGLELLDWVKRSYPALPFIAITGTGGVREAIDAIKRGAFDYLVKPFDAPAIRQIVARALARQRPLDESARPTRRSAMAASEELSLGLVGAGPAMRTLQTAIDFVARSNAPVLITGETGAGKELVARAIHARSARRDGAFVTVNTSAIPQELLESEIFGHTRGAFSGAAHARKGLLTEANGGTLLLDEIGDMPFGLQAKLLRVLQFGDVRPVGSDRAHHVDVRVIAATHRVLPALVKDGRFREDLYYRLNVLPLVVPPLRDHREDIPALAAHFLAEARQRAPQSPVRSIGEDALRLLTEASWRGNVRELASCIERAVVFGTDERIDARHFSLVPNAAPALGWSFPSDPPRTLQQVSRAYTEWVLARTDGNKGRAAEILGIDLSTLYRWLRAEQPDESRKGGRGEASRGSEDTGPARDVSQRPNNNGNGCAGSSGD